MTEDERFDDAVRRSTITFETWKSSPRSACAMYQGKAVGAVVLGTLGISVYNLEERVYGPAEGRMEALVAVVGLVSNGSVFVDWSGFADWADAAVRHVMTNTN